jgi:hypothetical protein
MQTETTYCTLCSMAYEVWCFTGHYHSLSSIWRKVLYPGVSFPSDSIMVYLVYQKTMADLVKGFWEVHNQDIGLFPWWHVWRHVVNNPMHRHSSDLDKQGIWEQKWKMEFHPGKCNVLTISKKANPVKYQYNLHGHILESVNIAKYLGCQITSDLRWSSVANMLSTLERLPKRLLTYLAPLRWTISSCWMSFWWYESQTVEAYYWNQSISLNILAVKLHLTCVGVTTSTTSVERRIEHWDSYDVSSC